MTPDFSTQTHGSLTSCGYQGLSGDICGAEITAFGDAQSARADYTSVMHDAAQAGGQVQTLTGLGDAAYYFVDERIFVLKGPYVFDDECFFQHRQQVVDEHVDLQFAQLLLGRI